MQSFYESSSFPTISRGVEGFLSLGVLRRVGGPVNACSDGEIVLELTPEYREEAKLQVRCCRGHLHDCANA